MTQLELHAVTKNVNQRRAAVARWLTRLLCATLLAFAAAPASAQLTIEITGAGEKRLPICR